MKVTRLKKGYRLRLSDTEFEALATLVEHGQADLCGEDLTQHPLARRVATCIESGTFSAMDAMGIDEDRR